MFESSESPTYQMKSLKITTVEASLGKLSRDFPPPINSSGKEDVHLGDTINEVMNKVFPEESLINLSPRHPTARRSLVFPPTDAAETVDTLLDEED